MATLLLRTDPMLLTVTPENLVGNAVIHSDASKRTATVSAAGEPGDDRDAGFGVRDTNDRIPEVEIATLRIGGETPLQHGRGVAL